MGFIIDINSKIYHREDCECIKYIHNKKSFSAGTFNMYRLGYKPCRKCSPLLRYYYNNKESIGMVALENGLKIRLRDESLLVDSHLSSWKIVYKNSEKEYMFKLYHENYQYYKECDVVSGEIMKKYHDQEVMYPTIEETLAYIARHDAYKTAQNNMYRKTKRTNKTNRYLYNRSKNRDIDMSTRRVCNLIDELVIQRENNKKEELNYENK